MIVSEIRFGSILQDSRMLEQVCVCWRTGFEVERLSFFKMLCVPLCYLYWQMVLLQQWTQFFICKWILHYLQLSDNIRITCKWRVVFEDVLVPFVNRTSQCSHIFSLYLFTIPSMIYSVKCWCRDIMQRLCEKNYL